MLWQSPSRLGWLQQLQSELALCGVASKIDDRWQPPTEFGGRHLPGGAYHVLRTMNYVDLVAIHNLWRVGGPKAPPPDLYLTPVTLRHWFCGDGRGGDRKGTLGFCTDGFSHEAVSDLVHYLHRDLQITALKVTNHRGHPQILIGRRDEAVRLRDLISNDIPECCRYKLRHVRPLQVTGFGRRIPEDLKNEIRLARGSSSMRAAAVRYGVSVSRVWKLWHDE